MIKNDDFILIKDWMVTELGLSGNDLLVYAIIYSRTQAEGGEFTGSLRYLADWLSSTKSNVKRNLNRLLEKGLLVKEDVYKNRVKFCKYKAVVPHDINIDN